MVKLGLIIVLLLTGCATEKLEVKTLKDVNPYYIGYLEINKGDHLREIQEGTDERVVGTWIREDKRDEGVVLYPNGSYLRFYFIEEQLKIEVGKYSTSDQTLFLVYENRDPNNKHTTTTKIRYSVVEGERTQLECFDLPWTFEKQESKGE